MIQNVDVFPVSSGCPTTIVDRPPTVRNVASGFGENWRSRTKTAL